MISINIHYSKDRFEQLITQIYYLRKLKNYNLYEKILCCDGDSNIYPNDFKVIEIKRDDVLYCRSKSLAEGVENSVNDIILYLDSDRLICQKFFDRLEAIENNEFIFPKKHCYIDSAEANNDILNSILKNEKVNVIKEESRVLVPYKGGKNPMSGCVCFNKETYYKSGGMDSDFLGWRYADTDYFTKCYNLRFDFIPLDLCDYHLSHSYEPSERTMFCMHLWNGIKYHKKWKIDIPVNYHRIAKKYGLILNEEYLKKEILCANQ
jgi:predicted glycosyltransferase involved in capsule biosynthesis